MGEEEEAAVDGDAGRHQREDLEIVHLALHVWLLFESEDGSEEEEEEDSESLDAGALRAQEHRDEDHYHLPEHHHRLPVVPLQSVPVVQEPELLSDL